MKRNRWIATGLTGTVLLMSLAAGLAMAQTGATPAASQSQDQQPAYTGSIAVQDPNGVGESQEAAQYQALAKVRMDEAVKAAQSSLQTTEAPSKVSLENENGYLVWEVVIGSQETKVDAGTGKVLHSEQASHEERGEKGESAGERGEQSED